MRFLKTLYMHSETYKSSNSTINDIQDCFCSSTEGFFITKKQASITTAIILFLFLALFISGFFVGKKSSIEEFSNKLLNGSFEDQAKYSFYSLYGGNSSGEENEEGDSDSEYDEDQQENDDEDMIKSEIENQKITENSIVADNAQTKYVAELIGFGSESAANQFAKKVQKKGYNVHIRQRKSIMPRNKSVRYWYQIVTDEYSDKSKLEDLVEKLKITENLNGVKIIQKK